MGDEMGNTMSDDASLAAAGAGENEQRALDMLDRGALLGIEIGEQRHISF